VLSLYASGRTTGIVLDAGDGVSHAVPVYEGFAIPNSIRRIDVAGRDVTEYMQTLLRKSGYVFHTSAEKEVVRIIKEKHTYLPVDPRKEEKEWMNLGQRNEGKWVEYTLPDGKKIRVGLARTYSEIAIWPLTSHSWDQNASVRLRFCLIPSSLGWNIPDCIRSLWMRSIGQIWIYGSPCIRTSFSRVGRR